MKLTMNNNYKKTSMGYVPTEWGFVRVEEIASIEYGISESVSGNYNPSIGIPILTGANITLDGKIDTSNLVYIDKDKKNSDRFELKKGDLLFNWRSGSQKHIGKTAIFDLEGEYTYASFILRIRFNEGNDPFYYHQLINYLRDIGYFSSDTSTQVNFKLNASSFRNLKLINPPYNEQRKIAQILITWDKAIELKEKLIEQKKELKKGLMQRLLTGKVRLPGFEGEWKKVRLGSIGSAYNGLTGKNKEDFGSGKPYIPYKSVFNGSRINIDQLEYVQISETEKQNKVKYGDIIFTTSSETPEEVGMSSVLLDHVDELYLNSFCFGYRLNDFNTLIPEFAQYLFRGNVFRKELLKLAQGSTRFNLSKNEVLKIKIKIPGLEEQKKIASVLTIFDREIDLLEQELESLKQQKKGLMQLLLTGKVRVKC